MYAYCNCNVVRPVKLQIDYIHVFVYKTLHNTIMAIYFTSGLHVHVHV